MFGRFDKKGELMSIYLLRLVLTLSCLSAWAQTSFEPNAKYSDSNLSTYARTQSYFTREQIESRAFVKHKNSEWQACRASASPLIRILSSGDETLDRLRGFIEKREVINSITKMHQLLLVYLV